MELKQKKDGWYFVYDNQEFGVFEDEVQASAAGADYVRANEELSVEKQFPLIQSNSHGPKSINFSLLKPFNKRAILNHNQDLEPLANRGGLSYYELYCLLNDKGLDENPVFTDSQSLIWVENYINGH